MSHPGTEWLLHHRNIESVGVKGLKSEKGKDDIGSDY
jgi:hypothetical protein